MKEIYDPIEFIDTVQFLTIAIIGSFVTYKFLNVLYDHLYEPAIDIFINCDKTDKYYIKLGQYYVQMDIIFKEFIKWVILLIFLMIVYNILVRRRSRT